MGAGLPPFEMISGINTWWIKGMLPQVTRILSVNSPSLAFTLIGADGGAAVDVRCVSSTGARFVLSKCTGFWINEAGSSRKDAARCGFKARVIVSKKNNIDRSAERGIFFMGPRFEGYGLQCGYCCYYFTRK